MRIIFLNLKNRCFLKYLTRFLFCRLNYFIFHKKIQKKIATFARKIIQALKSFDEMRV